MSLLYNNFWFKMSFDAKFYPQSSWISILLSKMSLTDICTSKYHCGFRKTCTYFEKWLRTLHDIKMLYIPDFSRVNNNFMMVRMYHYDWKIQGISILLVPRSLTYKYLARFHEKKEWSKFWCDKSTRSPLTNTAK